MSNKQNLEILFDMVLDKFYKLRKSNPLKFNGKGAWQPIKQLLEKYDKYNASKWKRIPKSKTKEIMHLPEYTINGYGTQDIIENHHFIIQQVRIPLQEKPTIKKIIQIALNIGQYKGSNKGKLLINYNNINDFIYKDDIVNLSKHLDNDIIEKITQYLHHL